MADLDINEGQFPGRPVGSGSLLSLSPAAGRLLLGLVIGTDVQAYDPASRQHANLLDLNTNGHPASVISVSPTGMTYVTHTDAQAALLDLDAAIVAHLTLHSALTDLASSGHPASIISVDTTGMAHVTHANAQQAIADLDTAIGSGGDLFAYKAADATPVVSSTALADDPDLQVSVVANAKYVLTASILYDSGQTGDLKLKWVGPTGATLDWQTNGLVTGATGATGSIDKAARTITSTPGVGAAGAGTVVGVSVLGLLKVSSTAGTFKLQWAQNTSDATNTFLKAGSFIELKKVA